MLPTVKPIIWTEPIEPNEDVRYDHVYGESAFGQFLITWKGWKKYDSPTVDETPWSTTSLMVGSNLEDAKRQCQEEYEKRILNSLELKG